MKKFLMVTSQLPEKMLNEHIYTPADNPDLAYGAAHFPAIPLFNAYVEEEETVEVITITYDIPECHRNIKLLEEEIAAVCTAKHASYSLDSIEVPFDDSIEAILNVYQQLIKRLTDGDDLFADITYGSKPMPIVLTMALQYAYRTLANVSIECVVYGQISHHKEPKEAKIYDVTALVQLDEIVSLIADSNVADPAAAISKIIGG